jgi:hypothetical protein
MGKKKRDEGKRKKESKKEKEEKLRGQVKSEKHKEDFKPRSRSCRHQCVRNDISLWCSK